MADHCIYWKNAVSKAFKQLWPINTTDKNMSISVRLTSDRKIQLPENVVQKMDLSTNDEIIVEVEDNKLILIKKEGIQADSFSGPHNEVWNNTDAEEYLKDEGNCGDNSGY